MRDASNDGNSAGDQYSHLTLLVERIGALAQDHSVQDPLKLQFVDGPARVFQPDSWAHLKVGKSPLEWPQGVFPRLLR